MEHSRTICSLSASCQTLWRAGAGCSFLRKRDIVVCDIRAAINSLLQKDTFPFHIWRVVLTGAVVLFMHAVESLEREAKALLRFRAPFSPKKPLCVVRKTQVEFSQFYLTQYLQNLSREVVRFKEMRRTAIDIADTRLATPQVDHAVAFGPQNDFEAVLGTDVKMNGECATPARNNDWVAGNETTIRKRGRKVRDAICCVNEGFLRAWMNETREITAWRMMAPVSSPAIICPTLANSLKSVLKKDAVPSVSPAIEACGDFNSSCSLQVFPVSGIPSSPPPISSSLHLNESEPQASLEVVVELALPAESRISFSDVAKANPGMKRAAIFLKLLQMSQAGVVILAQEAEFGMIAIQRL